MIMIQKILIIEDDVGIANSLKLYLENSWYEVEAHHTWENAVEKIMQWDYNIIILDINLPEKDGIQICREVRENSQIPIIMLTARNSELDKVVWLEIWADDYVSKPFSPRELLARIQSILRRVAPLQNFTNIWMLSFANITMDTEKFIVTLGTKEINLTKNEFDILKKLMEENGKIVKRETLMTDVIWYENYAFDRTIDTHIKNLRRKLENKDIIVTIRGEWYRMNN